MVETAKGATTAFDVRRYPDYDALFARLIVLLCRPQVDRLSAVRYFGRARWRLSAPSARLDE